jgi:hypothetical protein
MLHLQIRARIEPGFASAQRRNGQFSQFDADACFMRLPSSCYESPSVTRRSTSISRWLSGSTRGEGPLRAAEDTVGLSAPRRSSPLSKCASSFSASSGVMP